VRLARETSLGLGAAVAAIAAAAVFAFAPSAAAHPPWEHAEEIRTGLFSAQTDLLLGDGATAAEDVAEAEAAITSSLERGLRRAAPGSLRELRATVADAAEAARSGDEVALAAARGRALATLRAGAFAAAVDAANRGDAETARDWLLIREFRQATRFTRPGVDATEALAELEAGEASPDEAVVGIRKDLLDAYQARLRELLEDADVELVGRLVRAALE
jgi:high-affinity iron transporter